MNSSYPRYYKYTTLLILGALLLSGCSKKAVYINTNTETERRVSKATIFMIAPNDKGKQGNKIACDDSLVSLEERVDEYDALDPVASVKAAFTALSAVKNEELKAKKLQNPFEKSKLTLTNVEAQTKNEVIVHLDGKIISSSDCDALRQRAQIEELLTKAAAGKALKIKFNGRSSNWAEAFASK